MTSSATLDNRYGTPRTRRKWVLPVVAGVVAAVGLSWLWWVASYHSSPEASSELVSFDVVSPHRTEATFQVQLSSDDIEGRCLLRAYAEDHTVVGEQNVTVDSSTIGGTSGSVTGSVRTERRATSVEMVGCTTPNQKRPR